MEFPDVPVHLLSKGVWEDVFWSRGPRAQDPNITQEALGKWDWNCCHMMAPVKHHDKKADGKMKEFRNCCPHYLGIFSPMIWSLFQSHLCQDVASTCARWSSRVNDGVASIASSTNLIGRARMSFQLWWFQWSLLDINQWCGMIGKRFGSLWSCLRIDFKDRLSWFLGFFVTCPLATGVTTAGFASRAFCALVDARRKSWKVGDRSLL